MQIEIIKKLQQIIEAEICKLADDDVQGHIWWNKFRSLVYDVEAESEDKKQSL